VEQEFGGNLRGGDEIDRDYRILRVWKGQGRSKKTGKRSETRERGKKRNLDAESKLKPGGFAESKETCEGRGGEKVSREDR